MVWIAAVLCLGGALASYHQPFVSPSDDILSLSRLPQTGQMSALHIVSGGCRCSQAVMKHLLQRRPMAQVSEEVVIIDGDSPYLPETNALLAHLQNSGFLVTHLFSNAIPPALSLHGVPLLVVVSASRAIAYKGGYGPRGDQDEAIIRQSRAGISPTMIPVVGCAVGARVRRRLDPLHIKYD